MCNLLLTEAKTERQVKVISGRDLRTLADALQLLSDGGHIGPDDSVTVSVDFMLLPNGDRSGIILVSPGDLTAEVHIAMPLSASFMASDTLGRRHKLEITRLNGAISDAFGNVSADGVYVHAVEFLPTKLCEELTPAQEEILHHVIVGLRAENECYRSLDETLLPGFRALDYGAVASLGRRRLPSLKALHRELLKRMPHVSRDMLATALANAGLRRPRSGVRAA